VKRLLVSLLSGALFALGLALSGMTDPHKVLGFLDIAGHWDPTLAVVMGGAMLGFLPAARFARGSRRPLLAPRFHLAPYARVDLALVMGSLLFGIGWGLAGYCPGPALLAATARPGALSFLAGMLGGMGLFAAVRAAVGRWQPAPRLQEGDA